MTATANRVRLMRSLRTYGCWQPATSRDSSPRPTLPLSTSVTFGSLPTTSADPTDAELSGPRRDFRPPYAALRAATLAGHTRSAGATLARHAGIPGARRSSQSFRHGGTPGLRGRAPTVAGIASSLAGAGIPARRTLSAPARPARSPVTPHRSDLRAPAHPASGTRRQPARRCSADPDLRQPRLAVQGGTRRARPRGLGCRPLRHRQHGPGGTTG